MAVVEGLLEVVSEAAVPEVVGESLVVDEVPEEESVATSGEWRHASKQRRGRRREGKDDDVAWRTPGAD